MNDTMDPLEHDIAALTIARGSSSLWKAALDKRGAPNSVIGAGQGAMIALVMVSIVALVIGITLPSLGKARQSSRALKAESMARLSAQEDELESMLAQESSPLAAPPLTSTPRSRQIVRRAQIELSVQDLRDAYTKAADLIRPEFGEYIESSNYDARAYSPVARLKLRVAADRLDRALADLRSLGELTDESSSGEDASARAIDLDARLANARRIETELLELMDRRADDDLADILQLRREIDDIRLQIERLEAQKATLSELVTLATITVTLRATETDEPDEPAGFGALISDAFDSGVAKLSASAAWIVHVAVGGAIWWAIGLLSLTLGIRWARRAGL